MDQATVNNLIKEFRTLLVSSGIHVNEMVLFGSQVSGNVHEGSDIDMIIISDDFRDKDIFERFNMTMIAELETRKKFPLPLDILTMTPEEFHSSKSGKFFKTKIVA